MRHLVTNNSHAPPQYTPGGLVYLGMRGRIRPLMSTTSGTRSLQVNHRYDEQSQTGIYPVILMARYPKGLGTTALLD